MGMTQVCRQVKNHSNMTT